MRRIKDEDGSVIQEQEDFIELASSEYMLQQLKALLASGAQERLDSLPDGIHSGLHRAGYRGLFFYFTAPDPENPDSCQHYWRYYDVQTQKITDNRFTIASLIACVQDTPRFLGETDVFAVQEKVKAHILESIRTQAAMETAPKIIEPIQQTARTILRGYLNNPTFDRKQVRNALRILSQPMIGSALKKLKSAYDKYQVDANGLALLNSVLENSNLAREMNTQTQPRIQLSADDLYLVCWEYIWS
jgi:hypothetical protein